MMLPYLALGLKGEMYYCCCCGGGGVISCFAVGTKEGVEILNDNGSSLIYLYLFVNETFSHFRRK